MRPETLKTIHENVSLLMWTNIENLLNALLIIHTHVYIQQSYNLPKIMPFQKVCVCACVRVRKRHKINKMPVSVIQLTRLFVWPQAHFYHQNFPMIWPNDYHSISLPVLYLQMMSTNRKLAQKFISYKYLWFLKWS